MEEVHRTTSIDILDIHKGAYLLLHNIEPVLVKRPDGRVVFRVPLNDETRGLLVEYECNPHIPVLHFVNALKRLRGRMLDLRDGNGQRKW